MRTEASTTPADTHGEATFTVHAAPLAAAGRFTWQLRTGPTSEPLGVSVLSPVLPRLLVLEGAPHFDTAALRRWYEGAAGTLSVRTQVGKENTQFAAAQDHSLPRSARSTPRFSPASISSSPTAPPWPACLPRSAPS